jgi:hypothetical protein
VDEQVIVGSTEDELQRAAYALNNAAIKRNFKISVNKTKAIALKGKLERENEMAINNHRTEQVNSFNSLGYTMTPINNKDIEIKISRFNQMRSSVRRALNDKKKCTQIHFIKLWCDLRMDPKCGL